MHKTILVLIAAFCLCTMPVQAQKNKAKSEKTEQTNEAEKEKTLFEKTSFSGLKFRELGPALTSGRISDFAMHPENSKIYYIATSAGGVWKTINAGTTFEPLFDSQGSYSIGVVTLDPSNPNIVWVGTGENNNQRSVAYGDGIYKSEDAGKTWKHMGLKNSEHIGSIIVHPDSSNVIYVAAIGPLWKSGGERGVYKSNDGGDSWNCMLSIDEHTGANEIVMDPRNPNVLYASALQRQRRVFTYLGGGPESGLYKTTDGGKNWAKANKGLPDVDLGRIGLAISPANPEIIYAIVEAAEGKGGFYRSTNRGASWEKRGSYTSSGNYYQEIIADPINQDKVYGMNTWMQVSLDGGKTFQNVGEDSKHVDNHCMWIDDSDTDHFIVGCDGGIYETWDAAKTWDFKANLPVIQFYKVAVDNSEPFYYIYGGTQDNFSLGGPSRTVSGNGIPNEDWFITHGGDGFESQVDQFNTDIVYTQSQYGSLARYDKKSGEEVGIKPKARKDENSYRWNWDAPLISSVHKPGRVYFAANKVFKSDDYGSSWQVISDDITRQIDRNELEIMDRVWGIDAVMKNMSTSQYGTIVALSESPLDPNLLFAGTDDGLIQITADGGQNWTAIEHVPGVPDRTYVNAVVASNHSAKTLYACFNNHKNGDFAPYIYRSDDQGATWTNISAGLPERGSAYAIMEDHVDRNLLFVGTEFGVFFSNDGGENWKQLKSGMPTVAVRDIDIQRRENDLVLATFGRGFFVLDDYTALRSSREESLEEEAILFEVRDALLYESSYPLGLPGKAFQGDSYWQGDNLGSVAIFDYYIKDKIETLETQRRNDEKESRKIDSVVTYPAYEDLVAERNEENPMIWFTIKSAVGNIVRKMVKTPATGVQRIEWDLRTPSKNPISLGNRGFYNPFAGEDEGTLVAPGAYTIEMALWHNGQVKQLAGPIAFNIIALENTAMPAENREAMVMFKAEVSELSRALQGTQRAIGQIQTELRHIRKAITQIDQPTVALLNEVREIESELRDIRKGLNGDPVAGTLDIDTPPSVSSRVGSVMYQQKYSTSTPTQTHINSLAIAEEEFRPLLERVHTIIDVDMMNLRKELQEVGAPYTPGALPKIVEY